MFTFFIIISIICVHTHAETAHVNKAKSKMVEAAMPSYEVIRKASNFEVRCYKDDSWISRSSNDVTDKGILHNWQKRIKDLMTYMQGENEAKIKWSQPISAMRYKFSTDRDLSKKEIMAFLPHKNMMKKYPKPSNPRLKIISSIKRQCYYVRKFRIRYPKVVGRKKRPSKLSRIILRQLNILKESIFDGEERFYKQRKKVVKRLSKSTKFFLNLQAGKKKPFEIMIEY